MGAAGGRWTIARRLLGCRRETYRRAAGDRREEAYAPHPGGYDFAGDLVAGLKRVADFEITVAAYPEIHPTAPTAEPTWTT